MSQISEKVESQPEKLNPKSDVSQATERLQSEARGLLGSGAHNPSSNSSDSSITMTKHGLLPGLSITDSKSDTKPDSSAKPGPEVLDQGHQAQRGNPQDQSRSSGQRRDATEQRSSPYDQAPFAQHSLGAAEKPAHISNPHETSSASGDYTHPAIQPGQDKSRDRSQEIKSTYSDQSRAEFKYTGLSDQEIAAYRRLDQGLGKPQEDSAAKAKPQEDSATKGKPQEGAGLLPKGGPQGGGWDTEVAGNPAALARERLLKIEFDKKKAESASMTPQQKEAAMTKLDKLNADFIGELRKTNPDAVSKAQLDRLEELYKKRNRALFLKPGGKSDDM